MTKEELYQIVLSDGKHLCIEKIFSKKFPTEYDIIVSLNFPQNFKFVQKLYHYLNDDLNLNLGICPVCGKRCSFEDIRHGYKKTCSRSCAQHNPETQRKIKLSCLKKYGVENVSQNEEIKRKQSTSKQITLKNKYGVDNVFQIPEVIEKWKSTCIKKYGTKNFAQTKEWREKTISTNQQKYGTDFYCQTPEYSKYHRKRIEYDGITFDSSWEIDVYKFCKDNNLDFEYQPSVSFDYEFNGTHHKYKPDFLINNKLYEIKGDHFFKNGKMICPFNRNRDDLFEAKHQCMIRNNVIILKMDDIKKLKEVIL